MGAGALLLDLGVPLAGSLLFTCAAITVCRWWRPVLYDDRPVQRWVWVVPLAFVCASLVGIDVVRLHEVPAAGVALLVATQLVGWSEELMFRGFVVVALRRRDLREGQVAVWSSVLFGAAHLSGLAFGSVLSVPQAVLVGVAGYYFYLTRRVSGSLFFSAVVHGTFDFMSSHQRGSVALLARSVL
jgi:membrane protease YdiL (CAAX protease family)